jgi:membrane protein required for colicin V production
MDSSGIPAALTGFDYAVLLVVGLSALRGLWRGLIAEVFALVGLGVAAFVGAHYAHLVLPYIPANWPGGELTRWLVSFAVVFAAVLLVANVVSALLSRITQAVGLGPVDSMLGLVFGAVRGALIVLIVFALARTTELPKRDFWKNSVIRPYAERGLQEIGPLLPSLLAAMVRP